MFAALDGFRDAVDGDDPLGEAVIVAVAESAAAATTLGGASTMGAVLAVAGTGGRSGAVGLVSALVGGILRRFLDGGVDFVFFFHVLSP